MLVHGGVLHASTNGHGHMRQLHEHMQDGAIERVRGMAEEAIARDGAFRIEKAQGVLHAPKP